eukprot:5769637-Amphidinium_carterae.1
MASLFFPLLCRCHPLVVKLDCIATRVLSIRTYEFARTRPPNLSYRLCPPLLSSSGLLSTDKWSRHSAHPPFRLPFLRSP